MGSVLDFLGDASTQWVWGAAQSLAIVVGFYFVIRQISLARHQNSISHMIYFRELWQSPAILRARRDFAITPVEPTGVFLPHEDVLATFANDLGIAVRTKQVDAEHIGRYFGYYIEGYWIVLAPQILKYREVNNSPSVYSSFEHLYRIVADADARRGLPSLSASGAERFRSEEKLHAEYHMESRSGTFD